jgi:hypothetical protein
MAWTPAPTGVASLTPRSGPGISARGSHSPEKNSSTKNSTPPTAAAALLVKLTAATSSPSVLAAAISKNARMNASGCPIEALNVPVPRMTISAVVAIWTRG